MRDINTTLYIFGGGFILSVPLQHIYTFRGILTSFYFVSLEMKTSSDRLRSLDDDVRIRYIQMLSRRGFQFLSFGFFVYIHFGSRVCHYIKYFLDNRDIFLEI